MGATEQRPRATPNQAVRRPVRLSLQAGSGHRNGRYTLVLSCVSVARCVLTSWTTSAVTVGPSVIACGMLVRWIPRMGIARSTNDTAVLRTRPGLSRTCARKADTKLGTRPQRRLSSRHDKPVEERKRRDDRRCNMVGCHATRTMIVFRVVSTTSSPTVVWSSTGRRSAPFQRVVHDL